jgi:hypothetical protein
VLSLDRVELSDVRLGAERHGSVVGTTRIEARPFLAPDLHLHLGDGAPIAFIPTNRAARLRCRPRTVAEC